MHEQPKTPPRADENVPPPADAEAWRQELASCGWRPAGAGRRIAATLLDMVLFAVLAALILVPLAWRVPGPGDWSIERLQSLAGDTGWLATAALALLGLCLMWWLYFIVGWGWLGATPGKRALGLEIVDHRLNHPVGPGRAALRLVAYAVSSLLLGAGHLLVLVRRDRRALHDLLAGTQVVRRLRPPPP